MKLISGERSFDTDRSVVVSVQDTIRIALLVRVTPRSSCSLRDEFSKSMVPLRFVNCRPRHVKGHAVGPRNHWCAHHFLNLPELRVMCGISTTERPRKHSKNGRLKSIRGTLMVISSTFLSSTHLACCVLSLNRKSTLKNSATE